MGFFHSARKPSCHIEKRSAFASWRLSRCPSNYRLLIDGKSRDRTCIVSTVLPIRRSLHMRLIAASCFDARYTPGPEGALSRVLSAYGHEKSPHQSDASDSQERRCIQWPVKGILSVHFYNYIISLVESGLLWRKCSKVFLSPFPFQPSTHLH